MCRQTGYNRTLLAELPLLTNLDGERNPQAGTYTKVVEQVSEHMDLEAAREPDFSFVPPEPWFATHDFVLPQSQVRTSHAMLTHQDMLTVIA